MKIAAGTTTPICITYRRSSERPTVKRTRRFVGFRQLARNAWNLIADSLDSIAYEVEEKVEMGEDTVAVHWALEIEDPWGSDHESSLMAIRVPECPPAGQHFEIFKVDPRLKKTTSQAPAAPAPKNGVPQDEVREKLRAAIMSQGLYDPEAGPEDDPL